MCGITGWVDYRRDLTDERDIIAAMSATMECRGPDAGGIWCARHAAIGHRRLSVIDIEGGIQPMLAGRDPDVVLTFSRCSASSTGPGWPPRSPPTRPCPG